MNGKDIEKRLKNESERFTPDPLDKIKSAARSENLLPYDTQRQSGTYRQGDAAVTAKSKRKTVWLFAAFAAVCVCCIAILPFVLDIGRNKPFDPVRKELSAEDVYAIGAVSGVRLLGSGMPAGAVKTFSALNAVIDTKANNAATDGPEDKAKRQAKRFNEYFTALDSFLGEDILSTYTENNTDSRYPYKLKMTITGNDLAGNTISYVMYYTETLTGTETDDEEGETESEYRLEGIMSIDGVDYRLEGERTEETEKDETETELKIRAYADITDKTTYIQMEQERSEEEGEIETEYVYSVYANGELVEQTAVEFEKENKNNKTETEYELEFRSGATKGKYILEREEKGDRTAIKVKYEIDGRKGVFHIREISDPDGNKKYEYTFDDNDIMIFRKTAAR